MAIQFARARFISRAGGGNVARSAAYNGRTRVHSEYSDETFDFSHRDDLAHHEIILPDGAPEALASPEALWQAAQAAETRINSQEARELVIALPSDDGVSDDDRKELVRTFVQEHFVSKGLAAQIDIHRPHDDDKSDPRNHHAHVLLTTRYVGKQGFGAKARDLHGQIRKGGTVENNEWGKLWGEHQRRYFATHNIDAHVEATSASPQSHIGPVRFRAEHSDQMAAGREEVEADLKTAYDPTAVIAAVTRNNSTFTRRDVAYYIDKRARPEDAPGLIERTMGHQDVVPLKLDPGEPQKPFHGYQPAQRYSTVQILAQEKSVVALAEGLQARIGYGADGRAIIAAQSSRTLNQSQLPAFQSLVDERGLAVMEGLAGVGKSYVLGAVVDAYEKSARQVVGLAPTHQVTRALASDGFKQTMTVAAFVTRAKNDRLQGIERGAVMIVDEAGMLSTNQYQGLLEEAEKLDAKVILAGDRAQLGSIEQGGLFAEIGDRSGRILVDDIQRHEQPWQRQAALELARGKADLAVQRYHQEGRVAWRETQSEAQEKLVSDWGADRARIAAAGSRETQFVFAYTNKEVDSLNQLLREKRRELGELKGEDQVLQTRHGKFRFAVGDEIIISKTDRDFRLINGDRGVVDKVGPGEIRFTLEDGTARDIKLSQFDGIRHGYAGTIYRGQGATIDRTYLVHSKHWRLDAAYVALTRQRKDAHIYVDGNQSKTFWTLANALRLRPQNRAAISYGAGKPHNVSQEGVASLQDKVQTLWARANASLIREVSARGGTASGLEPERALPEGAKDPASAFVKTIERMRVAPDAETRAQLRRNATFWGTFVAREQALVGAVTSAGVGHLLKSYRSIGEERPFDRAAGPDDQFDHRQNRNTPFDRFKAAHERLRDASLTAEQRRSAQIEIASAAQRVVADANERKKAIQNRFRVSVTYHAARAQVLQLSQGIGLKP